jgi:hypothetical protein
MSRVDAYGAATRGARTTARWGAVAFSLAACSGRGSATETDVAGSESDIASASSGGATSSEATTEGAATSPPDGTNGEGDASESSPPSHCVDVIDGDVEIDDRTDPEALEALRTVRLVTGKLFVNNTQGLQDLSFLECLEEVGSSLVIGANESLETLHGLERLERVGFINVSIGPWFLIVDNPVLGSLEGLDGLRFVSALSIYDNPSLTALELPSLQGASVISIGGCRQDAEDVPAVGEGNNASLVEINGLESLENVTYLQIGGQENLTSIAHLGALAQAGTNFNDITIQYNPNLPVEEIEAFFTAAGKTISDERVCGNLGGAPECTCWTVGE